MLTKGAIGNLVNRYKAVLAKCNLINTFGSLAVASMLVLGGAGVARAAITGTYDVKKMNDKVTNTGFNNCDISGKTGNESLTIDLHLNDDTPLSNNSTVTKLESLTILGESPSDSAWGYKTNAISASTNASLTIKIKT